MYKKVYYRDIHLNRKHEIYNMNHCPDEHLHQAQSVCQGCFVLKGEHIQLDSIHRAATGKFFQCLVSCPDEGRIRYYINAVLKLRGLTCGNEIKFPLALYHRIHSKQTRLLSLLGLCSEDRSQEIIIRVWKSHLGFGLPTDILV